MQIIQKNETNIYIESNLGTINVITKKPVPSKLTVIPHISYDDVIGRDGEINGLKEMLENNSRIIIVNGVGGIGKTTVAKYFINKKLENFKYKAWIDAGKSMLESIVTNRQLTDSLGIEYIHDKDSGIDLGLNMEIITGKLNELPGNNILIIDIIGEKCEDIDIFDRFGLDSKWKVLVVSRQEGRGFIPYTIESLSPESARALFYKHYTIEKDDAIVHELFSPVEYHTLTIEVAAKTAQYRKIELKKLKEIFGRGLLEMESETLIRLKHNNNQRIGDIYEYILKIFPFAGMDANTEWILTQFSVLPPIYIAYRDNNGISICDFLKISHDEMRETFPDAIISAENAGWLKREDYGFKMHKVLQDVMRERVKPDITKCVALINTFVERLSFTEQDSLIEKREYIIFAESLLENVKGVNKSMGFIAGSLSMIVKECGDLDKAMRYQKDALRIRIKCRERKDVIAAYSSLGSLYKEVGNLEESIRYNQLALRLRIKIFGEINGEVAQSYNNLGLTYKEKGEYDRALELYSKVIEIKNVVYKDEPIRFADTYMNIAVAKMIKGEYDDALSYLLKVVEVYEKDLNKKHPYYSFAYNRLGNIYRRMGQYDVSLEKHRKAVELAEDILGKEHFDLAIYYNDISFLLSEIKDYIEAIIYQKKAVEIAEKRLPKNHYFLATYYTNLSMAYFDMDDVDNALKYQQLGLIIKIDALGERHDKVANSYNNFADIYEKMGQTDKALENMQKACDIYQERLGKDNPQCIKAQKKLARLQEGVKSDAK